MRSTSPPAGHGRDEPTQLAARILALVFLAILSCSGLRAGNDGFYFTVTSDLHDGYSRFSRVCDAIDKHLGGAGVFHVTVGDQAGSLRKNRAIIDNYFGSKAVWYLVAGNHDVEKADAIEWLRNEYENGNSVRIPLSRRVKNAGPKGSSHTTYAWDYGNAHFVVLNLYWNGKTNEGAGREQGSDTAGKGDVVLSLYKWLEADLASCDKPFIFVFGHEPAFPQVRHVGNSLDGYEENRDAFWKLLETSGITAYICGHTHYYSARKGDSRNIGNVWQISAGSAGRKSRDGETFLHIVVEKNAATLNVYRNSGKETFVKYAALELAARQPGLNNAARNLKAIPRSP